jgi:dTMP kinase
MFISFEGIDFCGKSTQVKLLKKYLEARGERVTLLREPGGTQISEQIRKILLDNKNHKMCTETEILLFSASRAQLVRENIAPLLQDGWYVLSDRFFDSTTAYQGYGRGIALDMVKAINSFAVGEYLPSVTFFLDIPVSVAIERQKKSTNELDRIETSSSKFFEDVRRGYGELVKTEKRFFYIDATMPIEQIHDIIIKKVLEVENQIKK